MRGPTLLAAVCPTVDGYEFHRLWNSFGNDLNQAAADTGTWRGKINDLKGICNGNAQCAGAWACLGLALGLAGAAPALQR